MPAVHFRRFHWGRIALLLAAMPACTASPIAVRHGTLVEDADELRRVGNFRAANDKLLACLQDCTPVDRFAALLLLDDQHDPDLPRRTQDVATSLQRRVVEAGTVLDQHVATIAQLWVRSPTSKSPLTRIRELQGAVVRELLLKAVARVAPQLLTELDDGESFLLVESVRGASVRDKRLLQAGVSEISRGLVEEGRLDEAVDNARALSASRRYDQAALVLRLGLEGAPNAGCSYLMDRAVDVGEEQLIQLACVACSSAPFCASRAKEAD